ncbi:MAG: calcium-binding protein [Pseudomonadota bacterium]
MIRSVFDANTVNAVQTNLFGALENNSPAIGGVLTVTTLEDEAYDGGSETEEAADGVGLSLREALAIAEITGERITFDGSLSGGTAFIDFSALQFQGTNLILDGDLDDDGVADISIRASSGPNRTLEILEGVVAADLQGVSVSVDTFDFDRSSAIEILSDGVDLAFDGTIQARATGGSLGDRSAGIRVSADDVTISVSADSTIFSEGRYGIAHSDPAFSDTGISGENFINTTIINAGTIESQDDAIRIVTGRIENSGVIRSQGTFDFGGNFGFLPGLVADAVSTFGLSTERDNGSDIDPGGELFSLLNTETGLIEGWRSGIITSTGGTITNEGAITGQSSGIIAQTFRDDPEDNLIAIDNSGMIDIAGTGFGLNDNIGTAILLGGAFGTQAAVTNSGVISSGARGISSDVATTFINEASGQLVAGQDATLDSFSDLAYQGVGVERFAVDASLVFPALGPDSSVQFSQDNVFLTSDGQVSTPFGVFPLPPQVPVVTILGLTAPRLAPFIDFNATQSSGEVTFLVNEFGDFVFPNTTEVPTEELGNVIVQPLGSNQFAVASTDFQPIIFVPEQANLVDNITNFGLITGRIDTGAGDDIVIQSGTHNGFTRLGAGDDVYDGTLSSSSVDVEGGDGNDTIIGSAFDDILSGDNGADTLTGGAGDDTFLVFASETGEDTGGDLITDFSVGDTIQISPDAGIVPFMSYSADADDPTQGTLTASGVFDGSSLRFENLDPSKVFVVERDDPFDFTADISLAEGPVDGVFELTLDGTGEYFSVVNRLQTANITITEDARYGISETPDFNFGAFAMRFLADDLSVSNAGEVSQASLNGEAVTLDNTGTIGVFDKLGVGLFANTPEGNAELTLNNSEDGVLRGIYGARFGAFADTESATLRNAGLIEGTFGTALSFNDGDNNIRNFTVENTGTMRTIASPFGFAQASLGISSSATETFTLDNSGLISVDSAVGGYFTSEAATVITGQFTETATITNSGTIQSTGTVVAGGFIDDGDRAGVVRVTNEATGRILADTNDNGDGSAISGATTALNLDGSEFETRTRFEITNSGEIIGDVELFAAESFALLGALTSVFDPDAGFSRAAISIPGLPDLVLQELDSGALVFDEFGDPVFPENVDHPSLGTITIRFSPLTGVDLLGPDGDPIIVLPDAEDIDAGLFDDVLINTGSLTGGVDLGIGDDVFDTSGGSFEGSVDAGAGDDLVIGATSADLLFGGTGDDRIFSLGGNDLLSGGAGDDFLDGSSGRDTVTYALDVSELGATQGIVMQGNTVTDGFGDTDTLSRVEEVIGTELDDVFEIADAAGISVLAGDGNDFLRGSDLTDTLSGDDGDDFLAGGAGNDVLSGGAGNDRMFGEDGNDALNGGEGNDYVVGNGGNDSVAGGSGDDRLEGRDGNDRLFGEGGNDELRGGNGDDVLIGNDGDDTLRGDSGDDRVDGRSGDDLLIGGLGNDTFLGGTGRDTLDYSELGQGIEVDLNAGTVTKTSVGRDTVDSIEVLIGTGVTDVLFGSDQADEIFGGDGFDVLVGEGGADLLDGEGGDDRLFGLDGNDELYGGEGDDYLVGNAGDDLLYGGDGNDNLQGREGNDVMFGEAGNDEFYGFAGNDFADGGDGDDFLAGYEGDDTLIGGAGNDRFFGMDDNDTLLGGDGEDFLIGNAGDDLVSGDAGNDNLRGRDGDDSLFGGGGNDFITGGTGDDILSGDGGFDTLVGEAGADVFVFAGDWRRDTVSDWTDGEDLINLASLGLKQAGETDADAFAKLTFVQDGTTAIISVTGDTRNDIRLSNTDVSLLDETDFVFDAPPPASAPLDSFDFSALPQAAQSAVMSPELFADLTARPASILSTDPGLDSEDAHVEAAWQNEIETWDFG